MKTSGSRRLNGERGGGLSGLNETAFLHSEAPLVPHLGSFWVQEGC